MSLSSQTLLANRATQTLFCKTVMSHPDALVGNATTTVVAASAPPAPVVGGADARAIGGAAYSTCKRKFSDFLVEQSNDSGNNMYHNKFRAGHIDYTKVTTSMVLDFLTKLTSDLSTSTLKTYKSALADGFRQAGVALPADWANRMASWSNGLPVASVTGLTRTPWVNPMPLSVLSKLSTTWWVNGSRKALRANAIMTLSFNLMARIKTVCTLSVADFKLVHDHIEVTTQHRIASPPPARPSSSSSSSSSSSFTSSSSSSPSFVAPQFPFSEVSVNNNNNNGSVTTPQQFQTTTVRLFGNPLPDHAQDCAFTALGMYFMSAFKDQQSDATSIGLDDIKSEEDDNVFRFPNRLLFGRADPVKRFGEDLKIAVGSLSREETDQGGFTPRTIAQAALQYARSFSGTIRMAAVNHRELGGLPVASATHTSAFSAEDDLVLGRVLAKLPVNDSKRFQRVVPSFLPQTDFKLIDRGCRLAFGLWCVETSAPLLRRVLAAVLNHWDYISQTIARTSPLLRNPLFQSPNLVEELRACLAQEQTSNDGVPVVISSEVPVVVNQAVNTGMLLGNSDQVQQVQNTPSMRQAQNTTRDLHGDHRHNGNSQLQTREHLSSSSIIGNSVSGSDSSSTAALQTVRRELKLAFSNIVSNNVRAGMMNVLDSSDVVPAIVNLLKIQGVDVVQDLLGGTPQPSNVPIRTAISSSSSSSLMSSNSAVQEQEQEGKNGQHALANVGIGREAYLQHARRSSYYYGDPVMYKDVPENWQIPEHTRLRDAWEIWFFGRRSPQCLFPLRLIGSESYKAQKQVMSKWRVVIHKMETFVEADKLRRLRSADYWNDIVLLAEAYEQAAAGMCEVVSEALYAFSSREPISAATLSNLTILTTYSYLKRKPRASTQATAASNVA